MTPRQFSTVDNAAYTAAANILCLIGAVVGVSLGANLWLGFATFCILTFFGAPKTIK